MSSALSSRLLLNRLLHLPRGPVSRLYSTTSSAGSSPHVSHRARNTLAVVSGALAVSVGSYVLGSFYPPELATYINPRAAPAPPEAHSPAAIAHTAKLERELHTLPVLLEHRARPDAAEWYETRPYLTIPEDRRVNSLTAGALRGAGRLALPPLVRARNDEKEAVAIVHVGRGLCGHDGIIHGGLLATLMDEALGRISILNLPEKIAVTAKLSVNYRAPTKADQFVVIKTHIVKQEGRKINVAGTVETLDGTVLVEASALFIQPRYAKLLNKKMIEQAMGERNQVSAFVPHPHRNPEPTPPEPPAVVSVAP